MNVALKRFKPCTPGISMESPFDGQMGFTCRHAVNGEAVYAATAHAGWHNPTGRLHGGFLAGLADAAMGAAFQSLHDAPGTNTDLDLRFLRPVADGELVATARHVRRGQRVSLLACDIHDGGGRLVATAQSQFLAL